MYEHKTTIINETSVFVRNKILMYCDNYIRNSKTDEKEEVIIDQFLCCFDRKTIHRIINEVASIEEHFEWQESQEQDGVKEIKKQLKRKPRSFTMRRYDNCVEFIGEHWNKPELSAIRRLINAKIKTLLKEKINDDDDIKLQKKLDDLQDLLKISEDAIECLFLFYLAENKSIFENITDKIDLTSRRSNYKGKINKIQMLTNIPKYQLSKILKKKAPLRQLGLIDEDFEPEEHIVEYLEDISDEALSELYFKKSNVTTLDISVHKQREKDTSILENIITNKSKKGVNILLYGIAGAGKTEYCKSLANYLNKILYFVNNDKEDNGRSSSNSNFRITALKACQNSINSTDSIIVVDEADELLNGSSNNFSFFLNQSRNSEKNIINDMLDNTTHTCIWITNHYNQIEASTRRRFDYSIDFPKFTFKQRLCVWKTVLEKHKLSLEFTNKKIAEYAKKYDINAGGIDVVLRNYKLFPEKERSNTVMKNLITPHLKLMNKNEDVEEFSPVKNYSIEGLNIKGEHSITDGLEILCEFSNFMDSNKYLTSEFKNMNLLLYGAPGTGKTEFVKYLAKKTGRELILKRGSDFLGMYVGETEQNIKRAFKEAEGDNAILFIDEADGLLFDRAKSTRGFEMTQVNELLIQIENFKGILVCSSNFQKNMDSAAFRRFNLKFEFDYLENCGKRKFYEIYFAKLTNCDLRKKEESELYAINGLTPGDFKVVKQKYFFFNKKINNEKLILALQDEVKYKNINNNSKIGFGN